MADEDSPYLNWIRLQKCSAREFGGCFGRIDPHHTGRKGIGQRAHDHTAIPLCRLHHRAWHDFRPPFTWGKDQRHEWASARVTELRASYEKNLDPFSTLDT